MRLVEIRWVDSWNLASGWHRRKWVRRRADDLPKQRTVGYLVAKTKRTLVVASSLNRSGGVAAVVAIPRSAITKVRRP